MGKEVNIADLAAQMISLSGFKPYEDIEIIFSGIRPGEKLFEELSTSGENISKTKHPKIYIGKFTPSSDKRLSDALEGFAADCEAHDEFAVRERLGSLLPEASLSPSIRPLPFGKLKPASESLRDSTQAPEFAVPETP